MIHARPVTADEDVRWDALVESTGVPHVLQSRGWAEVKRAGGWRTQRFVLHMDGAFAGVAQVLVRALPLGQAYAYAPRGPLLRDVRDLPAAVGAVAEALRGGVALLVDPEIGDDGALAAALEHAGLRRVAPVQPRRTLVIDLAAEPADLLAGMRRKTRQYVRKAERDGVATEESDDINSFYEIERVVADRRRFGIHERPYFDAIWRTFAPEGRANLFFARCDGKRVATLLVLRWGERAWEMFGGPTGECAEQRPFYLLKWRAMLRMRALGVRSYDMWGLAESDRPDDPLAGVENFKLGFGGEERAYVGAWEAPLHRALYPLWRLASRLRPAAW